MTAITHIGKQTITSTYDAAGIRLTQVDNGQTTSFTHDSLNRLTSAAYNSVQRVASSSGTLVNSEKVTYL